MKEPFRLRFLIFHRFLDLYKSFSHPPCDSGDTEKREDFKPKILSGRTSDGGVGIPRNDIVSVPSYRPSSSEVTNRTGLMGVKDKPSLYQGFI